MSKHLIVITCDEPSHASRLVRITSFERSRPLPMFTREGVASALPGYRWEVRAATSRGGFGLNLDKPDVGSTLRGDEVVPDVLADEEDSLLRHHERLTSSDFRMRYALDCRLCGLAVRVRGERLAPVLDALAARGIDALTLKGLGATVR